MKGGNFGNDMRRKAIGLEAKMRRSRCSETVEREKPNMKNPCEKPAHDTYRGV